MGVSEVLLCPYRCLEYKMERLEKLVVNVVGELQQKRTLAASRGFLAAARLSCYYRMCDGSLFSVLSPFICLRVSRCMGL